MSDLFSVVVVTWNSAGELPGLLESLQRHTPNAEIVVVDNASTDRTENVAVEADVLFIQTGENLGFGAANNIGIARASGDVVVMLNPDTVLLDDSLLSLVATARTDKALFGPRLLNDDGSWQPSASVLPASAAAFVRAIVPAAIAPKRLREWCDPWRATTARFCGWLSGACVVARRDVLLELGPYDTSLHLYSEDLDLGLRAAARGYQSIFAPNLARVVHLGDRSVAQRFSDLGLGASVRNRRVVVESRLGRRRARADTCAETLFYGGRFVVKKLLKRDAAHEAAWLKTAWRSG
jgi:N-acetylglucosaminyl-diphospho-decaprenol L-rhamnosyltransferase